MKLHLKESNEDLTLNDFMAGLENIPSEDIDHWETDLYLRKTPKTTELIKTKLPKSFNVTTFIDDIDHVPWYEIPFAFPKQRNRKAVIDETHLLEDSDDMETWDIYYWDKEDMEKYNLRQRYMTSNEVKNYVANLNAKMDDYDREHGFWDYEMA